MPNLELDPPPGSPVCLKALTKITGHLRQSPDLLVNVAKRWPPVEAFLAKDPLAIQQEMRDEWGASSWPAWRHGK